MVRFCGCGSWPVRLAALVGSGGWLVVCLCVVGCGFVCVVAFSQICGIFHLHSGHLILTSAPSGNLSCKLFYCKRTRHWSYSWLDIYDANRTESISGSGLPFQSKIPRPSLVVGRKAVERNVMFSDDGESPALVRFPFPPLCFHFSSRVSPSSTSVFTLPPNPRFHFHRPPQPALPLQVQRRSSTLSSPLRLCGSRPPVYHLCDLLVKPIFSSSSSSRLHLLRFGMRIFQLQVLTLAIGFLCLGHSTRQTNPTCLASGLESCDCHIPDILAVALVRAPALPAVPALEQPAAPAPELPTPAPSAPALEQPAAPAPEPPVPAPSVPDLEQPAAPAPEPVTPAPAAPAP
ncbi:hypothetical protein L6452_41919 [Arctium lappa]|uniref:Uncharacterized protein n=1 Tax=Arctium lappa TaxID=4217 RepID=A0ACB8XHB2_ARCLA|nr:hypothetical protein L6452_41919 [Arctium lappa]